MSAKTISASDLRNGLADALDAVGPDDILIITRRGKKERAIIDLDKLEDLLAASDPEYLKTIVQARAEAKHGEIFTIEEVFGDL